MAITADKRAVIGATYNRGGKIAAADGVPGAIIMLAYFAGGTDLFPASIGKAGMYLLDERLPEDHAVLTDTGHITELLEAISKDLGKNIGAITGGSFPVYLCKLRNGKRPGSGEYPKVKTHFESDSGLLTIWPRKWDEDMLPSSEHPDGMRKLLPFWVQMLAEQKGL